MLFYLFAVALHLASASAATLTYDWHITWVTANPDGLYPRPVIGINGEWPIPVLNFIKGDRVIANVYNALGNETTSVHFHGFFQNGTNNMDGPPAVTQCEIPPGSTFTYNFTVSNPTTRDILNRSNSGVRSSKQGPIGITRTLVASFQMDSVRSSLSQTLKTHTGASMTRSWSLPCLTGTISRWQTC